MHLHVKELLICSSTVALPVEAVNTQLGGLSPEQSCKYWNLQPKSWKACRTPFWFVFLQLATREKRIAPWCSQFPGWEQGIPSAWSPAAVLSPRLYSKTGLQTPLLYWEKSCGALLILAPSPMDVEPWPFLKAATKSTITYCRGRGRG